MSSFSHQKMLFNQVPFNSGPAPRISSCLHVKGSFCPLLSPHIVSGLLQCLLYRILYTVSGGTFLPFLPLSGKRKPPSIDFLLLCDQNSSVCWVPRVCVCVHAELFKTNRRVGGKLWAGKGEDERMTVRESVRVSCDSLSQTTRLDKQRAEAQPRRGGDGKSSGIG